MTFPLSSRSPCAKESTLTAPRKLVAVSASEWRRGVLFFTAQNEVLGSIRNQKMERSIFKQFLEIVVRGGWSQRRVFVSLYLQFLSLSLLCMLRLWPGGLIISVINSSACALQEIYQQHNTTQCFTQLATNPHCTVNNTKPYWSLHTLSIRSSIPLNTSTLLW